MKITFILPVVQQNGGCRVVAIYADKLLAMGHDVTVISRQPPEKSVSRRLVDGLRGHYTTGKDRHRTAYFDALGTRHIQIPWKMPLEADDVPASDIVVATWWRTAFEVAALPPEKGAKAYFVQHHEVHRDLPWDLSAGSYYLPLSKITIADWLVETMATRYDDPGVPKVENSVDTSLFDAPPRTRAGDPTVGFLYAKTPFKGVDVTLEAIARARSALPGLKVVAFGAVDADPALPLPEGTQYHKLPEQDRLRDIYAQCDIWLCGSRAEGFHLPPLEAMACRTPVVATRVGGTVETVSDGVNGYLVDVDDTAALSARLVDVASLSPGDWQSMSDAAHARAHAYTWDDAAQAFERELQRIIGL